MSAVSQMKAAQAAVKAMMEAATGAARVGDVFVFVGQPNLEAVRGEDNLFQPHYAKKMDLTPELVEEIVEESPKMARYVVESTRTTGGGTGHGPHDVFPDGYQITARILADDGSYDPDAGVVRFMQSGQAGSHCYNTQAQIVIVGKKTRKVTFI